MNIESLESDRFGYIIRRYNTEKITQKFLNNILNDNPDIAIIRIPTANLDSLYSVPDIFLHSPIVADTLLFYEACPRKTLPSTSPFRFKNEKLDLDGVLKTSRKAFENYKNHYLANPLLLPSKAQLGFVEWAQTLFNDSESIFWVAQLETKTIGFAACKIVDLTLNVILNAVDPDYASNGIYGGLVDQILNDSIGCVTKVTIATQSHNVGVQRTWQKREALLYKAISTIHLNLRKC